MGVDCTAYEHVELVEARRISSMSDDDWNGLYDAGNLFLYNLDVFEARGDGLPEGIYHASGKTLHWSWNYSGYGRFRRDLCLAVLRVQPEVVWNNYEEFEGRPFAPLIHFSDNEGFLGPKTCAGLANDTNARHVYLPDWQQSWQTWMSMFSLAAGTGVIQYT